MRRALASAGIAAISIIGTAACTPGQVAGWLQLKTAVEATPDTADDEALAKAYDELPDTPNTRCNQWFWYAIEAGWTIEDWGFLSQTMWGESRCNPGAHNASGASGLMQVMPMWKKACGLVGDELFIPENNLQCARTVYNAQGKRAWEAWDGRS